MPKDDGESFTAVPRPDGAWQDFDQVPPDEQRDVMEAWFRDHYTDPAEYIPYESAEGGYIWIGGGPYDPRQVLYDEFSGLVRESVIANVADKLRVERPDWARVPDEAFYAESYWEFLGANDDALSRLRDSLTNINTILAGIPNEIGPKVYPLLFANTITTIEVYLFDTFANTIFSDNELLRRFFATNEEFQRRQVRYSDIFTHTESAPSAARKYLVSVLWHNLAKVKRMFHDALGIDLGDVSELGRAVAVRHDIVHRNGRTVDGHEIAIGLPEVRNVLRIARELVERVEGQHYRQYYVAPREELSQDEF